MQPIKNTAFSMSIYLYDDDGVVTSPGTLTAKTSKDFASWTTLTATDQSDGYGTIKLSFTASQMNGDIINFHVTDNGGDTKPYIATIYPAAINAETIIPAIKAKTDTIPASPSTLTAAQVWAHGTRALTDKTGFGLAANQDVRNVTGTLPTVTLATNQPNYAPAKAGAKMDLIDAPSATALGKIRDAVQASGTTLATLLSRIVGKLDSGTHKPQSGDAYAIVNNGTYGNSAIKSAIPSAAPTAADISTKIQTDLSTQIARIDENISAAKTLTGDYNAAKTAAPASTALSTSVWTNTKAGYLDAGVSTRLAASTYTSPPTAETIAGEVWDAEERTFTGMGDILDAAAKFETMVESDGAEGQRFTEEALVNAPASAGGGEGPTPAQIWAYSPRSLTDKTNFELSAGSVSAIRSGLATGAAVSGLNNVSKAEVNSEVANALGTFNAAKKTDIPTDYSTFDPDMENVTVGGYAAGQSPDVLVTGFAEPTDIPTAEEVVETLMDYDYTEEETPGTFGRWLLAVRTLLGHKSVENAKGDRVSYKAEDDNEEAGAMTWDESTRTRGKYTGW